MKYSDITFWENTQRRSELALFRAELSEYFSQIDYDYRGIISDTSNTLKLRQTLNKHIKLIEKILNESGIQPTVIYSPPPIIGGRIMNISLLDNLFNLSQYEISPQVLIDSIDNSIGIYKTDYGKSILRTINPFYWVGKIINLIADIPFGILGSIGFSEVKIIKSSVGKSIRYFLRFVLWLGTILTTLWEVLQMFGLIQPSSTIFTILN